MTLNEIAQAARQVVIDTGCGMRWRPGCRKDRRLAMTLAVEFRRGHSEAVPTGHASQIYFFLREIPDGREYRAKWKAQAKHDRAMAKRQKAYLRGESA